MPRLLLGSIVLLLLCWPLCGQATAPLLALPQDGATPLGAQELRVTPHGVSIQVRERPLGDVLQRIQNESGIHFSLSRSIMALPCTLTLEAPDWLAAIRRLLGGFNRAEVVDEAQRLRRVLVLHSERPEDMPPIQARLVPADPTPPPGMPVPPPLDAVPSEGPPREAAAAERSSLPSKETGITDGSPPPTESREPDKAEPDVRHGEKTLPVR